MKNKIVVFGKPGAGKGTRLSKFLEERKDSFEVLSVSNLLKEAIKNQTEKGLLAASYMNAGELVPDEIVNEIVINGIKAAKKDVFIDGFPRTKKQAIAMLEAGLRPTLIVNFDVPDEVVIQRAKDRIICENCGEPYTINSFKPPKVDGICDTCGGDLIKRVDDDENTVKNRLKVYHSQTYPVLAFFESNGITIYTIDNTKENASEEFEKLITS